MMKHDALHSSKLSFCIHLCGHLEFILFSVVVLLGAITGQNSFSWMKSTVSEIS